MEETLEEETLLATASLPSSTTTTTEMMASKESEEQDVCCVMIEDILPEEMLSHVLAKLPEDSVAPAARACRRSYRCSPPLLRHRLSLKWACSSLDALKWGRANGCPWDEETCRFAAMHGQLEALQWARGNGCPWNEWTCKWAAAAGHLEQVLLQEKGLPE
ncbi:Ankyrin repeat domain-containing protein [Balamuthia mandrillaris]